MALARPLSLNKSNGLELPNADILSLFRQTTCSASASTHYDTLKVCPIYCYSDSRKFGLFIIIIFFFFFFFFFFFVFVFFFLLLQFKQPTTKLGLVIALIHSDLEKFIYTGVYMILHIFSQSRQTPGLPSSIQVLVLDAIFLFIQVPNT